MSRMIKCSVLGCALIGAMVSAATAGPLDFFRGQPARNRPATPVVVATKSDSTARAGQRLAVPLALTSGPCYSESSCSWSDGVCYDQNCGYCGYGSGDSWRERAIQRCRKYSDQTYYERCPPYCAPSWGYYPTCWRRMQECWQCPKDTLEIVPTDRAAPALPPAIHSPPDAPPVPEVRDIPQE